MKPDGGMAFPGFEYVPGHGANIPVDLPNGGKEWAAYSNGMTLRDYFAAAAMPHWFGTGSPESRAKACYAEADAMLAEREKP